MDAEADGTNGTRMTLDATTTDDATILLEIVQMTEEIHDGGIRGGMRIVEGIRGGMNEKYLRLLIWRNGQKDLDIEFVAILIPHFSLSSRLREYERCIIRQSRSKLPPQMSIDQKLSQ